MFFTTNVRGHLYRAEYALYEGYWYRIEAVTMDDVVILETGNDPLYAPVDDLEATLESTDPLTLKSFIARTEIC
jgi:hypothetical protein